MPFTGVYAIEDRIQMTDGGYASVDVLVYDTDGTLIYTLNDAACQSLSLSLSRLLY